MKKAIMAIAIIALFAGAANASGPYTVYFLTEGDDPTVETCDVAPGMYQPYNIRNWINNDVVNGFLTCQFGVDLGSDFNQGTTLNPAIATAMGSPTTDNWVVTFSQCQYDEWVWLCKYEMVYAGTPHWIYFMPASQSGKVNVATCEGGPEGDLPITDLIIGNEFGVNESCNIDAEEESWGAVKSMYR